MIQNYLLDTIVMLLAVWKLLDILFWFIRIDVKLINEIRELTREK